MTVSELIDFLKKHEFGGATGKPREVSFTFKGMTIPSPRLEVACSGDGLFSDIDFEIKSDEVIVDLWVPSDERTPNEEDVNEDGLLVGRDTKGKAWILPLREFHHEDSCEQYPYWMPLTKIVEENHELR